MATVGASQRHAICRVPNHSPCRQPARADLTNSPGTWAWRDPKPEVAGYGFWRIHPTSRRSHHQTCALRDPKHAGFIRELAYVGEWDEAIDNLIATLRNNQISIATSQKAAPAQSPVVHEMARHQTRWTHHHRPGGHAIHRLARRCIRPWPDSTRSTQHAVTRQRASESRVQSVRTDPRVPRSGRRSVAAARHSRGGLPVRENAGHARRDAVEVTVSRNGRRLLLKCASCRPVSVSA
jgi:hypothetical protein